MTNTRLFCLTLLLVVLACDRGGGSADVGDSAPSQGSQRARDLTGVVLTLDGEEHALTKKGDRYETSRGLKVKVEADRVKVKDASDGELAKVKKKDDGFKVYRGGADDASFEAKRRGGGYKLKDASDREVGVVEGGGGTFGGQRVSVKDGEVRRGDEVVATVKGNLDPTVAALLAAPNLTVAERLAMVIFVVELER